jgi:glutamine amidotransferase PdxT
MALIAERWGLIPELRNFASEGRPIWGTCAGLIFLADRASGVPAASGVVQWLPSPGGLLAAIVRYSKYL